MADKEVAIKINVDADGGAKSLSELKKEFKETQTILSGLTAGSKEYIKTLEKLGGIKDDIGDLNDEIKAFNPQGKIAAFGNVIGGLASGFQAAQGAAALFGAEGEELQKTLLKVQAASAFADGIKGVMGMGDAFKVLGNIIKANPLMLIVSIIIGIGAALFALKDKVKIIGDAFDFVGKIIGIVVQGFKDLTDFMGLTSNASDDLAATQIANAKKTGDAIVSRYDREIERAAAAGKNTLDLEKKKQLAIIETLRLEAIAIVTAARARGSFTDEENKRFTELIALTQKAADAVVIIDIKKNKQIQDNNTKAAEEKNKADEEKAKKDLENLRKAQESYEIYLQKLKEIKDKADADKKLSEDKAKADEAQGNADALAIAEEWLKSKAALDEFYNSQTFAGKLENLQIQMDAELALVEGNEAAKQLIREEYAGKEKDLRLGQAAATVELAQKTTEALQGLSDLYFSIKMANVQKGSAAEEKAAKQQFKVNKGLALTGAILSTAMAAIKSLSQSPLAIGPVPSPIGIASLAATILTGAASVAKIAATQYTSTSSGGGGGSIASLGSAGGGVALEPPSSGSTQLNADGTVKPSGANAQPTIKAVVVETDVTKTQKRVSTIEERASL
jgi:uncharacterized protein (DUF1330 family)